MKLSSFTSTVLFTFITGAVAFLYAPAQSSPRRDHYPICSPVAHEVQVSWQQGEISRAEAEEIIDACLDWEDGHSRR